MRQPVHHPEELEVLTSGETPVEGSVVSEHQPDPVPDRSRLVARVVTVDEHIPRGWMQERRHDLQQRRLTGTVGADEPHHLAAADAEVDATQRDDLMVGRRSYDEP